ncbi:MAG: lptC [Rickettsiales bacterium]|jgi:LPS export ABC transporter protein LptC|nr:lptC [Rickettsiales bacterium]
MANRSLYPAALLSRARAIARLKWSLVGFAGLLLLALVLWPLINRTGDDASTRLTFTSIVPSDVDSEKPGSVMLNPHFQGVDKRNRPFNVMAERAYQEGEDKVLLSSMKAKMVADNKGWYTLEADTAHFYISRKTMDVMGAVHIASDTNMELNTESLHVNMENGTISGVELITIKSPDGKLTAQGVSVEREASKIRFDGRVELVLYPPNQKNKKQ